VRSLFSPLAKREEGQITDTLIAEMAVGGTNCCAHIHVQKMQRACVKILDITFLTGE
jgi:hypothetical protein